VDRFIRKMAIERMSMCVYVNCAGRDTLRCLALATVDDPMDLKSMDLEDSTKFVKYEVSMLVYLFFTF